jgi:hypothetical protein
MVVLIAAFYLVISSALAGADDPSTMTASDRLCTKTARAARDSCEDETEADYSIALGKCNNLPASEREACRQQAGEERRDAEDECREQYDARREVCDSLGEAAYHPVIDPAGFVEGITNPFFPLTPGTTYIYQGGDEVITVTVTDRTKTILGVKCTVVRDVVEVDGQVVEDTEDYFAQDFEGNVWYFGEIAQEFDRGEIVSLAGSWKAGVNGAKPGIIMKASPQAGNIYRQEFLLGEAEDLAEVLSLTGAETVPAASCNNGCLITKDFTPLDPGAIENKYYARGIGLILEVNPETGARVELVQIIRNR